jgi:hypothetical protein
LGVGYAKKKKYYHEMSHKCIHSAAAPMKI